ncbi:MAG: DegV family protein [Oscillospiraceae bacterium]|nr:DegV family protein [Oscillospiraceae bacterium]MDY4192407.1 DegV family protein [Oscillospiraceae bacterium]
MMEKIKLLTDSASDIPQEIADKEGVTVLSIPITIEGKGYYERVDFTNEQFYDILARCQSIPTTSHIPHLQFVEEYKKAADEGYDHLICVTINSKGSSMFQAASAAVGMFAEEYPEQAARLQVHVVDSLCYTYSYGLAVVQAARLARDGKSCAEVLSFLEEYFARVETYFSVFSLDFAKKSGRISCAAAFVGDVLGLRPIFSIIDGEMKIVEKVRGDKNVVPHLTSLIQSRRSPGTPFFSIRAARDDVGEEMQRRAEEAFGEKALEMAYAGASITINAGPSLVGIMVLGEDRRKKKA